MFQAARKHIRAILTIGVASALVVGGVASAQSGSQGSHAAGFPPGPPPMMGGPQMKDLTYAQIHVQKNGQEQVLRLDQGKIASVDNSSVTLTENDGSSVTIPLDENTKVLTGPGQSGTVSDLSVGETVVVRGPEGGPAKSIMVPPKPGQIKGGFGRVGQMPPPPPGAYEGSSSGGEN